MRPTLKKALEFRPVVQRVIASKTHAKYTLQVGKSGEERLQILNNLYNPASQSFLLNVGISQRKNILDVGCGTGIISCWLAQQTKGRVLGIDISAEQIEIAKQRAESLGLTNIEFRVLSAFDIAKLEMGFDLIYWRFLLVHLESSEAQRLVNIMVNCLTDSGNLAGEEATASASFCYPPSPAFDRWLSLWAALRKANNADLDLGLKLPQMLVAAGCKDIKSSLFQPVLSTPHEKSVLRRNVIETTDAAVRFKFDSKEGMQKLIEELEKFEQEDSLVGYVRNTQISGQRHRLIGGSSSSNSTKLPKEKLDNEKPVFKSKL